MEYIAAVRRTFELHEVVVYMNIVVYEIADIWL